MMAKDYRPPEHFREIIVRETEDRELKDVIYILTDALVRRIEHDIALKMITLIVPGYRIRF